MTDLTLSRTAYVIVILPTPRQVLEQEKQSGTYPRRDSFHRW